MEFLVELIGPAYISIASGMIIWSFRLSSLSRGLLCARGNSPVGRHPSEGSAH